jgi:hypothetical protein
MNKLLARLRYQLVDGSCDAEVLRARAADEIERLCAQNKRLYDHLFGVHNCNCELDSNGDPK